MSEIPHKVKTGRGPGHAAGGRRGRDQDAARALRARPARDGKRRPATRGAAAAARAPRAALRDGRPREPRRDPLRLPRRAPCPRHPRRGGPRRGRPGPRQRGGAYQRPLAARGRGAGGAVPGAGGAPGERPRGHRPCRAGARDRRMRGAAEGPSRRRRQRRPDRARHGLRRGPAAPRGRPPRARALGGRPRRLRTPDTGRGPDEVGLLETLTARFGRASYEHVLSGPGLRHLHAAAHADRPCAAAPDPAAPPSPARITAAALAAECPGCVDAVDRFVAALGAEAGNLGLRSFATAGVYIGGGIAPRILPRLRSRGFLDAFRAKGPMRALAADMPVVVIDAPHPALLGAATAAAELAAERAGYPRDRRRDRPRGRRPLPPRLSRPCRSRGRARAPRESGGRRPRRRSGGRRPDPRGARRG